MKNLKTILIVVGGIILIALAYWSIVGFEGSTFNKDGGLKSAVIIVDGHKIYRSEFNEVYNSFVLSYGLDPKSVDETTSRGIKENVTEYLINQKVLLIAANEAGINVLDSEIEQQIQEVKEMFADEEEFLMALESEGLSYDRFRITVRDDLIINSYIESRLHLKDITIDNEEVVDFYNSIIDTETEGSIAMEDIYDDLETMIREEKSRNLVITLVGSLRDEAEIEILLK